MKKNYILLALSAMSLLVPSFLYAGNDVSGTGWPNNPGAGRCEANKSELMSLSCDKNFDFTLRYGDTYYFNDTFKANQGDKYLWAYCSYFDNHNTDYSNGAGNPTFSWRHRWLDGETKWMVPSNKEKEIIRSTNYHIGAVPGWGKSRDNITLRYVVFYSSDEAGKNKFKPHVECGHYAISRCGDGIVDKKSDTSFLGGLESYQEEECDHGANNGKDGKCTIDCKEITVKAPECNSGYDAHTKYTETSAPWLKSSDKLCNEGEVYLFETKKEDGKPREFLWYCRNSEGTTTPYKCNAKQQWCGDGEQNGEEKCDPEDKRDPSVKGRGSGTYKTCNTSCEMIDDEPICSSQYNGKNIYTSTSSSSIDSYVDKSKLCEIGIMFPSTFSPNQWTPGNPRIHYWGCKNGEKTISEKACKLNQYRCGDGIVTNKNNPKSFINYNQGNFPYESCEPSDPSCNDNCTWKSECGSLSTQEEVYLSDFQYPRIWKNMSDNKKLCKYGKVDRNTFTINEGTGYRIYTWKCDNNGVGSDVCSARDIGCGDGVKNGKEECDYKDTDKREGWEGKRDICSNECKKSTPEPDLPICNTAFSGETQYTTYSTEWLNENSGLCTKGKLTYFDSKWSVGSQRKFTWKCENDDEEITCNAYQKWCGDGVKNGKELCDPNDSKEKGGKEEGWGEEGCSDKCEPENGVGECGSTYNRNTYYKTKDYVHLRSGDSRLCDKGFDVGFANHYPEFTIEGYTYTWQCKTKSGDVSGLCRARLERCGDGKRNKEGQNKEDCDPNASEWQPQNRADGKRCNASCNIEYCGDGKKNGDEECDLGTNNGKPGYSCTKDCKTISDLKCGVGSGTTRYFSGGRQQNPWLTNNEMCPQSSIAGVTVDRSEKGDGHMSWTCKNENGTQKTCEAYQKWCGDGVRNYGELCDPNDTNNKDGWGEAGCSMGCKPIELPHGCDKIITGQVLRLGRFYVFADEFDPKGTTRYLYDFKVDFKENHGDYDNNPSKPNFSWTDELIKKGKKVENKMLVITTPLDPKYHIVSTPTERAWDNIFIEYTIWYDDEYHSTAPSNSNLFSHRECAYYEISRCGDGVKDDEYEDCDPGSQGTSILPDGKICNSECKIVTPPPAVCKSKYNGQTVETIVESNEELCETGTYSDFEETSTGWKWKCNNVAGKGTECSATKKAPKGEGIPLKTLVGTNKIEKVGDEVVWSLKVTASGGNITDFVMEDTLPPVLGYKKYEVKHSGGMTIKEPTKRTTKNKSGETVEVVTWKVEGTLQKGDYVEIYMTTYAKELPKQKYDNVLCERPWNVENEKKCEKEPIPPVCSSEYNGKTIEGTLEKGDYLCNVGKVTYFTGTSTGWKWKCNNEGSEVECSATKKSAPKGEGIPLKTLVGTNKIEKVGDEVVWSLKVTASGGNITNFMMEDTLPPVLGYKKYEVKHSGGMTIKEPTKRTTKNKSGETVEVVTWKVEGTLQSGDYVEIYMTTYAKVMPEREYDNVLCEWPENEENEKKCEKEPIPPVCNSKYNGETLSSLKEGSDLCSVGNLTKGSFTETSTGWIWECNDTAGTESCYALKEPGTTGELVPLKTLIGSKEIKKVGDVVEWSLKVTASGGDVTDFVMEDELPWVLGYTGYKVEYTPSKVTVQKPTTGTIITGGKEAETIEWKVKGTLHSGDYVELKLVTYAKVMPDKDYNNVLCVRPEDNPEEEDCVPAEITPTKGKPDIKKVLDGDKYVTETGQRLKWNVTIKAKGGDVDLDRITDKYPKKYVSFDGAEIDTGAWKNEGITIQKFALDEKEGIATWDVTGTLLSGHKIELLVYTKVHTMPDGVLKNIACIKPDPGNEECSEAKSYDLRIKKHILDKNGNKVKEITGNVNDKITYIIEFGNNGDESATVILKDYLPKGVKFESGKLVVNKKTTSGTTGLGNLDMMYEGETIQIDGVNINTYTEVKLAAKQSGTLTIVGTILEPKDENYNRTNFACIFVEDNKKPVDCDDAHHEVEPNEFKCEKLEVPSGNLPNGGGNKEVTCTASGGTADLIEIDCGEGASGNRYITGANKTSLKGTCSYPAGSATYNPICTVKKDGKNYTSDSCKGTVTVEGYSCFPAGTKVTMADGSKKNIEDVKVGDSVLSYNTDTNTNEQSVVQETFVHKDNAHEMYELTINGNVLKVTEIHPFYVRKSASSKDYAWIEAKDLKVGDILLMSDGNLAKIEKINHYSNVETVYNLEVANNHDYFVDEGYLVHNKGPTTCFIAGTKVTMADGSQKNIEDVKIGEKVLGSNGTVNTVLGYDRPVLGERHLWSINGSEYFVSDEHPFMTTQGWKSFNPEMTKLEVDLDTTELKVGDILITNNGFEEIKSVDYINADYYTPLYNFALDGDHTYYANNYLVHNKCIKDCNPEPTKYCEEQEDKMEKGEEYDPICELANPHCFNVNEGNFSIESGELLPFYFNVKREQNAPGHKFIYEEANEGDSCSNKGAVDLSSLKCRYVIRKPQLHRTLEGDDIVYSLEGIKCLSLENREKIESESLIGKWLEKQKEQYGIDKDDLNRNYWPTIKVTDSSKWENVDRLGEYQFQIEVYEYYQCEEKEDGKWEWTEETIKGQDIGVCQSNFVLTEPYTVQKTPSGNLTASTTVLNKFKQVDGGELKSFSRYLNAIATSDYHPNQKVNDAMEAFKQKYEKLAVTVKGKNGKTMKKVPGKNIYFTDDDFTVKNGDFTTPFTIVQTNPDKIVTIDGDSNLNMMILAEGDIVFNGSCTDNQNVKGIFYTKKQLKRTGVGKNTSLDNKEWCTKGGLNVKGVLIGNNFSNLMKDSRSHLETWFTREGSRDGDETQLTKKVMNGASVVIEYSPSIFTKSTMPPGAEDFTTALSIYKN